jgi:hypothetical protein
MARPALQRTLSEPGITAPDKVMLESVEKRVSHWSEMIPFYSDEKHGPGKTIEARATESVLNAVILASYDTAEGHLRPITRQAFDNAWALQQDTGDVAGAWIWQNFHLGPWEGEESEYQGAALLMVTALNAPDGWPPPTGRICWKNCARNRRPTAAGGPPGLTSATVRMIPPSRPRVTATPLA